MYEKEISRQFKALFVFLLDQSGSMEEPMGDSASFKKDELSIAINKWLHNMVIRATGGDGVKDWMDIAIIGYRTDMEANPIIQSPLAGALASKMLVSLKDIADNPARIEKQSKIFVDEETGDVMQTEVEVPVWVEPYAEGGTPMCSALYKAYEIVNEWINNGHTSNFPPIVIHITDGESSEGDPMPYADPLKELKTDDGNVLLFNCHLSLTPGDPFLFPHSNEILPNDHAKQLFDMSSKLPDRLFQNAVTAGFELQPGAKGMAFNADMVSLIKFLDMGTRVANNLR